MTPSILETAVLGLLVISALCLWVFLRQLRMIRDLANEWVEVPLEQPEHRHRRQGMVEYESTVTTVRMTRWDQLPPGEKLRLRRRVELWSTAVGLAFLAAMIVGYLSLWAGSHLPASHWMNRPLF